MKVKIDILSALKLLITQINIDKNKYGKRVEKAKKAAAARWEYVKKNAKNASAMRSHKVALRPHEVALHNDNGNVNDNVNVNVNVDVNDNVNVAAAAAEKKADGSSSAPAAAKKGFKKRDVRTDGKKPDALV